MTTASPQHVSINGLIFLCQREALVTCAYRDGGTDEHPKWSIGAGSQTNVKEGDVITLPEAFKRLRADVAEREKTLNRKLTVQLTPWAFDALFSIFYQRGTAALNRIGDLFNAGQTDAAIWAFTEFPNGAAGGFSPGHAKRRAREMMVAWDANYGDLSKIPFYDGDPRKVEKQWIDSGLITGETE